MRWFESEKLLSTTASPRRVQNLLKKIPIQPLAPSSGVESVVYQLIRQIAPKFVISLNVDSPEYRDLELELHKKDHAELDVENENFRLNYMQPGSWKEYNQAVYQ